MNIKVIAHTKQVNELETCLPMKEEFHVLGGRMAGICYGPEDYFDVKINNTTTALKRAENCVKSGHHSPFDHSYITLQIIGIPKIIAMILNSTEFYTTSEKSARYTLMKPETEREAVLYEKWQRIFKEEIKKYSDEENLGFADKHIEKLSMENARYMISVFTPTSMCYTTSIRRFSYMVQWLRELEATLNKNQSSFNEKLLPYIIELKNKFNEIFGDKIKDNKNGYFEFLQYQYYPDTEPSYENEIIGNVYSVVYDASFAHLAHIQRHRTLHYEMFFDGHTRFGENHLYNCYVPPILSLDLQKEWIKDFNSIADVYPQATLVIVKEEGRCSDFLLKCKERMCSRVQLEVMESTKRILNMFYQERDNLNERNRNAVEDYYEKPRCMFSDFRCTEVCEFGPKNAIIRKI